MIELRVDVKELEDRIAYENSSPTSTIESFAPSNKFPYDEEPIYVKSHVRKTRDELRSEILKEENDKNER